MPTDAPPKSPEKPTPQDAPFYQRWWNAVTTATDNSLAGMTDALYDTRQAIGRGVSQVTGYTEEQVKEALPYVAAGAVGLGSLLLAQPLGKAGKWLFSGVRWIVTGGGTKDQEGFLEKIPVLGYAFKGLGWVADTVGDWSGYILGGLAALLTFRIFQNREKAPPENPSTGTGAVGRPPETIRMTAGPVQTNDPVRPAAASPPSTPPPAGVNTEDYSALYAARATAITNGQTAISQALRPWMQYNNQLYENNMLFAASGWLWNGVPPDMTLKDEQKATLDKLSKDTNILPNARRRLLGELTHMGLTEADAASMVAGAPPLPMSPPGYPQIPHDLTYFAHWFQSYYGNDCIKVDDGTGTASAKDFDAMSLTQKREFLDGAINFAHDRYIKIWNSRVMGKPAGFGGGSLPAAPVSGWPEQTWIGQNDPVLVFTTRDGKIGTTTDHNGRTTNDCTEFYYLSDLNKDQHMDWTIGNTAQFDYCWLGTPDGVPSHKPEAVLGSGLHALYDTFHDEVAPAIDQHMAYLRAQTDFNTGQVEPYARAIHLSQVRLRILQEDHLALVGPLSPDQGVQTLAAVDLRNPTLGTNSPRIMLTGTFEGKVLHVTSIRLSPDSAPITLDQHIDIDLTHPGSDTAPLAATAGVTALMGRIDQLCGQQPSASVSAPGVQAQKPAFQLGERFEAVGTTAFEGSDTVYQEITDTRDASHPRRITLRCKVTNGVFEAWDWTEGYRADETYGKHWTHFPGVSTDAQGVDKGIAIDFGQPAQVEAILKTLPAQPGEPPVGLAPVQNAGIVSALLTDVSDGTGLVRPTTPATRGLSQGRILYTRVVLRDRGWAAN